MGDSPILITKITVEDNIYHVLYNGTWVFKQTYDQIKETAWNFLDVEDVLMYYERRKKICKIMNLKKRIYNNGVIYQKNDY
jgi:hydroxymethylpyrimidine pyrophosphatase-like HAD family hydrolase